jgi:hypothetical protein
MSDLAPLVWATLRDKVVADLMAENAYLRQKLQRHHQVKMVWKHDKDGCGGGDITTTTRAEGSLANGKYAKDGKFWMVNLLDCSCPNGERLPRAIKNAVPLEEIENVVLCVGGLEKTTLGEGNMAVSWGGTGGTWIPHIGYGTIAFFDRSTRTAQLVALVGPFPSQSAYKNVAKSGQHEIKSTVCHLRDEFPNLRVVFTAAVFLAHTVSPAIRDSRSDANAF